MPHSELINFIWFSNLVQPFSLYKVVGWQRAGLENGGFSKEVVSGKGEVSTGRVGYNRDTLYGTNLRMMIMIRRKWKMWCTVTSCPLGEEEEGGSPPGPLAGRTVPGSRRTTVTLRTYWGRGGIFCTQINIYCREDFRELKSKFHPGGGSAE